MPPYDDVLTLASAKRNRVPVMAGILVGYARWSTGKQDLDAQRKALGALGVPAERIYLGFGLTGTRAELAEMFSVSRPTVYRVLNGTGRARAPAGSNTAPKESAA